MEEKRLRRALRGVVAATVAGPLAVLACSGDGGGAAENDAAPPVHDASVGDTGSSPDGAADTNADGALLDAFEIDAYVDWCEAGAPYLVDASLAGDAGCDYAVRSPCGLPLGWRTDGYGTLDGVTCIRLCPVSVNLLTACAIYDGHDPFLDGAAAPFDAASIDGGPVDVECALCGGGGRRPEGYREAPRGARRGAIGAYFAAMARLEAASVPAFLRLARELGAHRAPRALIAAAALAARDEVRHARAMGALARRHRTLPTPPAPSPFTVRSLEAVAVENAIEGCVRETYGAIVAEWQASRARDAATARVMARVAVDEARHAALAWSVASWSETRLDARARRRVRDARRRAIAQLATELRRDPAPALSRFAGVPTAREAAGLLDGVRRAMVAVRPIVTGTPPTRNAAAERTA